MVSSLDTTVQTLATRVNAQAATASAQDLAYLSKAIEAIGGRSTILDLVTASNDQQALITANFTTFYNGKVTEFNANAAAINANANQALTLAASHQTDVPLRKTYNSSAAITLTVTELSSIIEIDAAFSVDFNTVDMVMPSALLLGTFFNKEFVFKNKSFAKINIKSNDGTTIVQVQPAGWARVILTTMTTAAGVWAGHQLNIPSVRDRTSFSPMATSISGVLPMSYEYYGPTGQALRNGYATYGNAGYVTPTVDQTGVPAAAIVSRCFDSSNSYSSAFINAANPLGGPVASWLGMYSTGSTHFSTSNGVSQFNVCPVKGGIVHFGLDTVNSRFDVGYFAAPNFSARTSVHDNITSSTYYYAAAHTFMAGQYVVIVYANSSSGLTELRRYKINSDNSVTQAGTITLSPTTSFAGQINDQLMMVFNGTVLGVYDMTVAGTTLTPLATTANVFNSSQANRLCLPVGRNCVIGFDGVYYWNGTTFVRTTTAYTSNLTINSWFYIESSDGITIVNRPPGSSDSVYFFDTTSYNNKSAHFVSGFGQAQNGQMQTSIYLQGGNTVFVSNGWCYSNGAAYAIGFITNSTALTRVGPGNFGISNLGGK